jgi:hypothetical protein
MNLEDPASMHGRLSGTVIALVLVGSEFETTRPVDREKRQGGCQAKLNVLLYERIAIVYMMIF